MDKRELNVSQVCANISQTRYAYLLGEVMKNGGNAISNREPSIESKDFPEGAEAAKRDIAAMQEIAQIKGIKL